MSKSPSLLAQGFRLYGHPATCLCAVFLLLIRPLIAQSQSTAQPAVAAIPGAAPGPTTGVDVSGHVRGPGGVPVPGATVLLLDPATGSRKETWTDETGTFVLHRIAAATYRLEVSLVGFKTVSREPVSVNAEGPAKVNVDLALTSTLGNTGSNASTAARAGQPNAGWRQIPRDANGRPDWSRLSPQARERMRAAMQARAQAPGGQSSELAGQPGTQGMESGDDTVRFSQNSVAADSVPSDDTPSAGADANSSANSFLLTGSTVEAALPTGAEGPMRGRFGPGEMGQQGPPGFGGGGGGGGGFGGGGRGGFGGGGGFRGGGAGFGFFTGLGGRRPRVNRIRGNVSETYTNAAFDARPYPLNVTESPRIPFYSQQLGVSVGGPLYLPHILNGKDKTSFFVNYNMQRAKSPFDSYSSVPTLLERTGDFSRTAIPSGPFTGQTPVIYQPLTGVLGPRTPFPQNTIPGLMQNPAAVALLDYIPAPDLPGSVQNYRLQESLPSDSDRLMVRIGQQISQKDNASVFYFFNSQRSDSVSSFPAFNSNSSTRGQNVNLTETHTFRPQLVNTLTFNFNRQRVSLLNPFANQDNVIGVLGIMGVSEDPLDWGVPGIEFTNFGALNLSIPSLSRNQTARGVDSVLFNHGKHNFRFGGELRRVQLNTLTDPNARGTFTFTGYSTSNFTSAGQPVANTGFDFADFLLGLPQATSVRYGASANYLRSWYDAGFVQDDWRLTSKFTFNYGLRYEYFEPFTERYGHLSDLEVAPGFSSAAVLTGLDPGPLPTALLRGHNDNFAPRIAIAYRPWTQRNFVIRSGYAIFYDESIYGRVAPKLESEPPFARSSTLLTSPAQPLTLQDGFPSVGPNVLTNTYAVDPNYRTPYAQTWNFLLQDEIAHSWILDLGYIGTKGTALDLLLGPNPAGSGNTMNALEYTYETAGASSNYNALQVSVRRQFHRGMSLWGRYTYSKALDDAGSVGGSSSIVAQNYLDLAAEYGLSTFDRRHQFLLNYTWELPFGDRHRYLNHGGPLEHVLGNWQVSGVTTLESGEPLTAYVQGNIGSSSGTGAYFSLRPDATGEPVGLPSSERNTLKYFNTAAFSLPPTGEFGNAGRETITAPPLYNFNLSLDRLMTFSRERGITGDFRIAANNAFNTPDFTGLGTVVNATNFGRVTGVSTMRTVTVSFRLRF